MCQTQPVQKCTTKIKDGDLFSILADEVVDISHVEQMPIVIRYVDINNNKSIKQHCLCMAECTEGASRYGVSRTILSIVKDKLNLDMKSCKGQSYDGAGINFVNLFLTSLIYAKR